MGRVGGCRCTPSDCPERAAPRAGVAGPPPTAAPDWLSGARLTELDRSASATLPRDRSSNGPAFGAPEPQARQVRRMPEKPANAYH